MKKIFTLLLLCTALFANAQVVPEIQWLRSVGSEDYDPAEGITKTADGGYIAFGTVNSLSGDVTSYNEGGDYWVVKFDANGIIQWERSYGGSSYEGSAGNLRIGTAKIRQTPDGGYILGGNSLSTDGDVSANFGWSDVWLVKISSTGDIVWEQNYGTDADDYFTDIIITNDGGFIMTYQVFNWDTLMSSAVIVKLDAQGNIEWQNDYPGDDLFVNNVLYSVVQTTDGGYVLTGHTDAADTPATPANEVMPGFNDPNDRLWVLKISTTGALEWAETYGGTDIDEGYCIKQDPDGNYVIAGMTYSGDGDAVGHPNPGNAQSSWVLKLDNSGTLLWQKTFGQASGTYDVEIMPDGNYVICGSFYSGMEANGEIVNSYGGTDGYLKKLNKTTGDAIWTKRMGGSLQDIIWGFELTDDGGSITTGVSLSSDGDLTQNLGSFDYWIVKLGPDCLIPVLTADTAYTVCSGDDVTLIAASADGAINWYASETSTTILFTGTDFIIPDLTAGTSYWVEAASVAGCTSERVEVVVTVNPLPALTVTTTAYSICENTTATLTASTTAGNDVEWFASADAATPIASGTEFTTPALTANISYWVGAASPESCVSARTEVIITVNPLPVLTVATTAFTICENETASLTAATAAGNVISWYDTATAVTPLATGTAFTTPALTANTSYWVEAASVESCVSARTEITVAVNPLPVTTVTTTAYSVCDNTSAVLTATTTAGSTIAWYDSATAVTPLATGNQFTTPALTANASYWVGAISAEGCASARTEVTVTVNPLPVVTVATIAYTICENTTAVLTAATTAGNLVVWYDSAAGTTPIFTGTEFTTPALTQNTSYWVVAYNPVTHCVSGRTEVTVTVTPLTAAVTGFSYAGPVCIMDNNPAPVTDNGFTGGGTYSATGIGIDPSTGVIDLSSATAGTYTVTYTVSGAGCMSGGAHSATIVITGAEAAVVSFSYGEVCTGNAYADVIISDDFTEGGTFSATSGLSVDSDTGEINITASQPGTYTVVYEVAEDVNSCRAAGRFEYEVIVKVCNIQRGISPNGDDKNEYFDLTGMGVRQLSIFNRYGQEMYKKAAYVKEWGGQDSSGNDMPTGTYFYAIEKTSGENLTGWIYINREN
ncbi:gliding motility-associated C-terminal domain-containing protein [uncultured Flavobacterium sp.]|uniref:Ig-like domain-containing protein n=1 Tax=uncultured Flavobacterium sp. TaxID=165435 RepID=UPI0025D7D968|nr:gliding motility-associated C-terminal domain-containing protein [uncultured Flavobacterium sp.]